MSVKITYYVHGTTIDNMEHKSTGWLPGQLSEKGVNQSKQLKENIAKESFDIVFTSDLKRAVDSAKINFEDTLLEIKQDERIRECNYGDLNGMDESLVKYEEHIKEPFPKGESLQDVEKRINEFLNFLFENYNNKNVAIVAHKAPQLAIEKIIYNKSWEEALKDDWRKTKAWKPGWKYEFERKEGFWKKGLKLAKTTGKSLVEGTKLLVVSLKNLQIM